MNEGHYDRCLCVESECVLLHFALSYPPKGGIYRIINLRTGHHLALSGSLVKARSDLANFLKSGFGRGALGHPRTLREGGVARHYGCHAFSMRRQVCPACSGDPGFRTGPANSQIEKALKTTVTIKLLRFGDLACWPVWNARFGNSCCACHGPSR